MSKRNLRHAATLAQAITVLDGFRWTWFARWTLKRIAKQLASRGLT